MKLTVPLRSLDEVLPLAEAGADELYCGVKEPRADIEYLPNAIGISRGSFASFEALSDAVSLAGSTGVPVVFVANSTQGRHTLAWQKEGIRRAHQAGVRRVVVTDFTLIPWIKRELPDLYIVLSTLFPVFNRESLAFAASMGIDRIVLDSLRTLREISETAELTRRLGIDLEIFTTPQSCLLTRANCNFHVWFMSNVNREDDAVGTPSSFGAPCHQGVPISVHEKRKSGWASAGPARCYTPPGSVEPNCVVCALWHLHRWGVPFVKIVGRHYTLENKLLYVRLAKRYLRELETLTAETFFDKGKETYKQIMGCDCRGKRCFYPDVRTMRGHLRAF